MRFFLFNYNKEGPGVSKDAPPKEGLALFWDIFAREFTSLIKLNLIFIVSCIPIITIGPAIGAMTSVTMKMVQDKPSDLYYDFKEAFKKNWKSSFLIWILSIILLALLGKALAFCIASEALIYNIIISILIIAGILIGIWLIYIYPMSVSIDLPLRTVVKNSFLLSLAYIKYSFLTLILCMALIEASIIFLPFTIPIMFFFTFSFVSFLSSFCAWHGIKKHILKFSNDEDGNNMI
ncbi:YesL family protein [Clostridium sp.]|uniref:YesL family protein n=1 Tax=Clostridium sp. TaxID=1506 RepID=UPI0026374E39|nr:YesL family protein [Clostridium sp.]